MNKTVLYIITIVLFCGLSLASELTLEETKDILGGDPYKIARWMENIKSVHGSFGYGQLPERTFKYRKGDCEDYAILAQYFIGDKYKTYIIVWRGQFRKDSKYYSKIWNKKVDHTVLAIKLKENYWGIIDQDKYITGAIDIKELPKGIDLSRINSRSLSGIIKINCLLRRINVEKAWIMDLLKLRRKIIEEIDLRE